MTIPAIIGLVFAVFAALAASLGACSAAAETVPARLAMIVEVKGTIGPATADQVTRSLTTANDRHAALVIIELDTPGGLDRSMRTIIGAILASPVPVACLVAPSGARAASAGTYILTACGIAAMAPGTTLGAATPVALGPGGKPAENDAHTAKVVNDAAAYIRGLAALHGRNAAWLETAVRQAATLTADEAASQRVIDFVATDVPDLLAKADGRTSLVAGRNEPLATRGLATERLAAPWHSRFLGVITDPEVAYLLMLVGIYGLIFEMISPGLVLPGLAGGISLLVALYALGFLPLDYAGTALLVLGLLLMAAEPFVMSHGVIGLAGIIAFAFGSVMMFGSAPPAFRLSVWVIVAAALGNVAGLAWLLGLAVRARRRPVVSGADSLVGAAGKVMEWRGRTGRVLVGGESWQARSADALASGQMVVITGRQGLVLDVAAKDASRPEQGGG